MLSRDAERIYWLARYIERTEDTARLIRAFSQTLLDMPVGKEMGWDVVLDILSAREEFEDRYTVFSERNVIKFLLSDTDNGSSIAQSVRAARENVRTSRDSLPIQAWELWNELHIYVKENAEISVARRYRYEFLSQIIAKCNQFNGFLGNSLSYNTTRSFRDMGRYVERSDMTTRFLDVGAGYLSKHGEEEDPFEPLLWMNLLNAMNALQMFRYDYRSKFTGNNVSKFLLTAEEFPRSVAFCLNRIGECIDTLPNHEGVQKVSDQTQKALKKLASDSRLESSELHELTDKLQAHFIQVNNQIARTWFPENV